MKRFPAKRFGYAVIISTIILSASLLMPSRGLFADTIIPNSSVLGAGALSSFVSGISTGWNALSCSVQTVLLKNPADACPQQVFSSPPPPAPSAPTATNFAAENSQPAPSSMTADALSSFASTLSIGWNALRCSFENVILENADTGCSTSALPIAPTVFSTEVSSSTTITIKNYSSPTIVAAAVVPPQTHTTTYVSNGPTLAQVNALINTAITRISPSPSSSAPVYIVNNNNSSGYGGYVNDSFAQNLGQSLAAQNAATNASIQNQNGTTITNGTFSGIVNATGLTTPYLTLSSSTPATTTGTLYQHGGTLFWNGSIIGAGGGGSTTWGTITGNISDQTDLQNALNAKFNSTGATSTIRNLFSSTATGLSYDNTTGIFSLTSGFTIPLTASTTDWNTAFLNRVTSVELSLPSIFTISGSPVTASGTLSATLASENQNLVLASPDGSSGTPTFRSLVVGDIPTLNQNTTGTAANVTGIVAVGNGGTGTSTAPALNQLLIGNGSGGYSYVATTSLGLGTGTVTSVNASGGSTGLSFSGGPVTTSGTLTLGGTLAVANGGTGASTFGQGWIYSTGGTGALAASSSPVVGYITATSTTATSTFAYDLGVSGNIGFSGSANRLIYNEGAGNSITLNTAPGIVGTPGGDIIINPGAGTDATSNGAANARGGNFIFTGSTGGASTIAGVGSNGAGSGGGIVVTGGLGGNAGGGTGSADAAGAGGDFFFTGGNGGVLQNSTASVLNVTGRGGNFAVVGGVGGTGVTAGVAGGTGGSFTFTAGTGGAGGAGKAGGSAGAVTFTAAVGADSTQSSAGTNTGGTASTFTFTGAAGGTGSNAATSTGGPGSSFVFTAGNGGASAGSGVTTSIGGVAGGFTFTAGNGGIPLSGGTGQNGGSISLLAGSGSNLSGLTNNGGNIYLVGGIGSPSGLSGNVILGVTSTGVVRGNVGIGTTSPANNLDVYSTASAGGISVDGTTNPGFNLRTNNVSQGYLGAVTSAGSYILGSSVNDIALQLGNSNSFLVGNGGAASYFTVKNGGNVGIGTTSPSNLLEVAGNGFFSGNLTTANIAATGTLTVTGATTLASSLSGFLIGAGGAVSAISTSSLATSLGVSNYLTNSGANTYLNLGTNLQAPTFQATSTTATSTILNALAVGSTTAFANLFVQGSSNTNPFIVASSTGTPILSVLSTGGVVLGMNASSTSSIASSTVASTTPVLQLGSTAISSTVNGYTFPLNGTYIAANAPSSFSGDFLDLQQNGTVKFAISSVGGINMTSGITERSTNQAFILQGNITNQPGYNIALGNGFQNEIYTSGVGGEVKTSTGTANGFFPTSGTGVFNILSVESNINQTALASGISRGIYINPTITSAFDYRNFESSSTLYTLSTSTNISAAYNFLINPETISSASTSLYTLANASTFNITGAPTGVTGSTTISSSTVLTIQGNALTNVTNGYGLFLNAPTGASNNYAAIFKGGSVGIGTATPNALLAIAGTSGSLSQLFDVASSSGASYFHITSAGNVGIGTSSPSNTLEVAGNIFSTGNATHANITATGTLTVLGNTTLGSLSGFLIGAGGAISAISTSSLATSLGVSNYLTNSGANTYLNLGTNLQAPTFQATSTTGTSTFATGGLAVGTNQFVVQQTSGSIGIGISTPTALLHIVQANVGGSTGASALNVLTVTGGTGSTGVTANPGGLGGNGGGISFTTGAGGLGGGGNGVGQNGGIGGIAGSLSLTTAASGNGNVGIAFSTGGTGGAGATSSSITISAGAAGTGGAGGLSGGAGGAGGAGATTTISASVGGTGGAGASGTTGGAGGAGGAGAALSLTAGNGGNGGAHGTGGSPSNGTGGAGGNVVIQAGLGGTGSSAGANGSLLLNTLGGNVGIGTSTPNDLLDIYNSASMGDSNLFGQIYIKNALNSSGGHASLDIDKGTSTASAVIGLNTAGTEEWDMGMSDDNNFHIRTLAAGGGSTVKPFTIEHGASANSFYINSSGNVGIGTSSPSNTLEVAGNIFSTGNATHANITATGTLTVLGNTTLGSLSGFLIGAGGAISAISTSSLATSLGVSNYLTNSGANTFINTGTNLEAPIFTATSTTGSSTFASSLSIGNSSVTASAAGNAFAFGSATGGGTIKASGSGAVAFGVAAAGSSGGNILASGNASFAGGNAIPGASSGVITASGVASFAFGQASGGGIITASGVGSFAFGNSGGSSQPVIATGTASFAMGQNISATANNAYALGTSFTNSVASTFQVGFSATPTLTVTGTNVGIGSTTPVATLSVSGTAGTNPFVVASSSNSQFLTLLQNGNFGIGSSTPQFALAVPGSVGFSGLTNSPTGNYVCIAANNSLEFSTTACSGLSSERYKHDITTLTLDALDEVSQFRPVSFIYNSDVSPGDQTTHLGFIAEEVNAIDPNLVVFDSSGLPLSVKYQEFVPVLTKAIQEQQAEIITLQGIASSSGSASTTALALADSPSFIAQIANAVQSLIQSAGNWVVNQVSASLAVFTRVQTQTAAVTNGLEMTDAATGSIYCVRISNGDWLKTLGSCTATSTSPAVQDNSQSIPDSTGSVGSDNISTPSPSASASAPVLPPASQSASQPEPSAASSSTASTSIINNPVSPIASSSPATSSISIAPPSTASTTPNVSLVASTTPDTAVAPSPVIPPATPLTAPSSPADSPTPDPGSGN